MDKFELNIDGSVINLVHNVQGDKTYLNTTRYVDNLVVNVEVWLADMKVPPDNSLIKVKKGHLDFRQNKAAQVFNRYTKKWSKHFVPRLYIQEYEVIGKNKKIVTEV